MLKHVHHPAPRQQERRGAPRFSTPGLIAWILGPVSTPATVSNISAGGMHVQSVLPLRKGRFVVSICYRGRRLMRRTARFLRACDGGSALEFVESSW